MILKINYQLVITFWSDFVLLRLWKFVRKLFVKSKNKIRPRNINWFIKNYFETFVPILYKIHFCEQQLSYLNLIYTYCKKNNWLLYIRPLLYTFDFENLYNLKISVVTKLTTSRIVLPIFCSQVYVPPMINVLMKKNIIEILCSRDDGISINTARGC